MPPGIEMEISNDPGHHTLRMWIGDSEVVLDASDLDGLIEALGLARVRLQPSSPMRVSREHRYAVETEPKWQVIRDPRFDGAMLFVRHTGFGWMGFAIPAGSLHQFAEMLTRPSTHPPRANLN